MITLDAMITRRTALEHEIRALRPDTDQEEINRKTEMLHAVEDVIRRLERSPNPNDVLNEYDAHLTAERIDDE